VPAQRWTAPRFSKGATAGDYDKDGYPDLYVLELHGRELSSTTTRATAPSTEVGPRLGVTSPWPASHLVLRLRQRHEARHLRGRLCVFDLRIPEALSRHPPLAEPLTLYAGQPDGSFKDVTVPAGINRLVPAMGANFGDPRQTMAFLDIYPGTGAPSFASLLPNVVLKNDAGRALPRRHRGHGHGPPPEGHGVAIGRPRTTTATWTWS
jgi:hypothetical protein